MRVQAVELSKRYRVGGRRILTALENVSLELLPGASWGVIGESGAGKSTLGRLLLGLERPSCGRVLVDDVDLAHAPRSSLRALRRKLQVIFQDPASSLNPRQRVDATLREALLVHRMVKKGHVAARVVELLQAVGLKEEHRARYPHALSGGERQRVAIARALAVQPALLVADEPTSSLDWALQEQILNLLAELQRELGLTLVLISHDLQVVGRTVETTVVMYAGRLLERAPTRELLSAPAHPYTRALLAAAPRLGRPAQPPLMNTAASPTPALGCVFAPRCPLASDTCTAAAPPLRPLGSEHHVACYKV